MFLIDTSVLVTAFTKEDATRDVLDWFARHSDAPKAINDWTRVEFSSAIMIKVRDGRLSAESQQRVMLDFHARSRAFQLLDVTREHFFLAAQICERSSFGIRSGDALHAAVALSADATLVTRDRTLLAASGAFGLKCIGIGA